jgi:hypothetical protein
LKLKELYKYHPGNKKNDWQAYKLITCLDGWNGQYPVSVMQNAVKNIVGIYEFVKPKDSTWLMHAVDYCMTKSVDSLKGDVKNIAVLIRVFKGLQFNFVKKAD